MNKINEGGVPAIRIEKSVPIGSDLPRRKPEENPEEGRDHGDEVKIPPVGELIHGRYPDKGDEIPPPGSIVDEEA